MYKNILIIILFIILALALGACAQRAVVAPDDTQDGAIANGTAGGTQQGSSDTSGDSGTTQIRDDVTSQDISRTGDSTDASQTGGFSTLPPNFSDILFDFDSYVIRAEARQSLTDLSNWLIDNNAVVLVEGHCDDRGTNEYNLALGDRRSTSVKDYMLANGVPGRKVETMSYGEERPLCEEQEESCWSINRRAHFIIGAPR